MLSATFRQTDDRERVREASSIADVIGEHVTLKARGREFVGLCPFHDDHKPSMSVVPHKGIFHCFVCGSGGDVFSFIEKYHRMEFREALEYLAQRGNIVLTPRERRGDESGGQEIARDELVRANEWAAGFFRTILNHTEHGRAARDVIAKRGISPAMVEMFGIGASPARWDGLVSTVQSKGRDPRPFAAAGLLKTRDGASGQYDSFRNRLMFPIHDQLGRVIAFGGRRIDDADDPKYLNSPETAVFEKSGTLYALNIASRSIQKQGVAVVTEGYTDAIACHQAGFTNVVATLGTALTRPHASRLRRLCDTVVLLFDGDAAGQKAADRAVEVFFAEEIDVRIATLSGFTDKKDPDDLLKSEGGAEVLRGAIGGAVDLLEYRYSRMREGLKDAGVAALSRALKDDVARLAELGLAEISPLRRRLVVRSLARAIGWGEDVVEAAIPRGRSARQAKPAAAAGDSAVIRAPRTVSDHALACLLCMPRLIEGLSPEEAQEFTAELFEEGPLRRVARAVLALAAEGDECHLSRVLDALADDAEARQTAVALAQHASEVTGDEAERLSAEWREALAGARLRRERVSGELTGVVASGGNRRAFPRPRSPV